jgi:cytochrome c peroxidase
MKSQLAWCAAGVIAVCWGAGSARSEAENRLVAKATLPVQAQQEIASVEAEINRIEDVTLADVEQRPLDPSQKIILLGKLLFYDQHLSVRRNEACAFCHMPETGFTGPVSALNQTTVSYPGSIRSRFGKRTPPNSHLRQLRTRVALQRAPRRSGGRILLGHARHGTSS